MFTVAERASVITGKIERVEFESQSEAIIWKTGGAARRTSEHAVIFDLAGHIVPQATQAGFVANFH